MIEPRTAAMGLVLSAWALSFPMAASAQVGSGPVPAPASSPNAAAMASNPYANPYLNPYLNPMMTQQPVNGTNALLYMYMANSARGGIGSGRLSNPSTAGRARSAERANPASVPGGKAAHYFNPGGAQTGGATRYYNQTGRYFPTNPR